MEQNRPSAHASVSMSAVAAHAGVSIASVSRVINGLQGKVSAQTIAKVQQAIGALGYRPMGAGRTLRSGQSRIVAVLAANLANPSMNAVAASAEVALRGAGLVMVLCDTHERPELQDEYLLEMRAQSARGIVLLGAVDSPALRAFVAAGEPLVFVNRHCPFACPTERFVGIDNLSAGREVAQWMLAQEHRSMGLIHARLSSSATRERVQGFTSHLKANGAVLPKNRVLTVGAGLDHLHIGYHAMARLLALTKPPQAVFCTSDLIAYGAARRITQAGLRVGTDITLVGFDDSPINQWLAPWLHAVRVPRALFGAAIVQALASTQGQSIVFPHRLVIRPDAEEAA